MTNEAPYQLALFETADMEKLNSQIEAGVKRMTRPLRRASGIAKGGSPRLQAFINCA